jgi:hypothetical protein
MIDGMNWIVAAVLGCSLVCMLAGVSALILMVHHNRRFRRLQSERESWDKWIHKTNPTASRHGTSETRH